MLLVLLVLVCYRWGFILLRRLSDQDEAFSKVR